ncbi:hypothetical protein CupriaWKF_22950 [Cupriavidus sp. WKF15]|uniref:hypothetical protein n=1 Tax=Cupriavidus sp. WKF15 TaxID=3032282 RepID=UPI0023E2DEF6|nr:hypothetical protein [Cupriavidus sp. WKF15]WER49965.1 hypothetical protein CupriaWKF_22950 [Cupriavidus sp. WKF15]
MATEIFAWGYTGWRTKRADGFELTGFIDGNEFTVVSATAEEAERLFCRAARRAWLRRTARAAIGLPGRITPRVSSADTYYAVSLPLVVRVATKELGRAIFRWLRR